MRFKSWELGARCMVYKISHMRDSFLGTSVGLTSLNSLNKENTLRGKDIIGFSKLREPFHATRM